MTDKEATLILIIDKEPAILRLLGHFLKTKGYHGVSVSSLAEATSWVENNTAHIVLADLDTDGAGGLHLLEMLRLRGGMSQIVAMSANPTVDKIIQAYHLGAGDYLAKPFNNMNDVGTAIAQATERLSRWRSILAQTLEEEGRA